ncbi:SPOR domain-containing protein [Sulfuricystis multivorans]|uniref:SPOR domain-containing protein n=1 Tax=Sulfuricystis multivorans TaxID=2211108 RepID=UPI000F83564E|nr:SPOR domain-containing protein [Sulfuricystis multivorans]
MAQENRQLDAQVQPDEIMLLKKRARRRLIGAVAVALFAAIVLPMVMDHQPAPPLKDLQVRIPSPDEGADRKMAGTEKPIARTEAKPIAKPEPKSEAKPAAESADKAAAKAENGHLPETKAENKSVAAPAAVEPKPPAKTEPKAEVKSPVGGESWEVQLGAYAEMGRVKNLLAKLKEMGLPAYTEKVDTPNGPRTRVRAGPFPSQDAAEKARARIKTIGIDGPVAKKS